MSGDSPTQLNDDHLLQHHEEEEDIVEEEQQGQQVLSRPGTSSSTAGGFVIVHEAMNISSNPMEINQKRTTSNKSRKKSRGKKHQSNNTLSLGTNTKEQEEHQEQQEQQQEEASQTGCTSTNNKKEYTLSILNRCGSAPDMPLQSTTTNSTVYSSAKKRQLLKSHGGTGAPGAGSLLTNLQRSRLTPLPVNIRTGTIKRTPATTATVTEEIKPLTSTTTNVMTRLNHHDLDLEREEEYETSLALLKARVTHFEKENHTISKQKQLLTKQLNIFTKENHTLKEQTNFLQKKILQLEKNQSQQKMAYEKLTEKYTSMYTCLDKMTSTNTTNSQEGQEKQEIQSIVQCLSRENQELQRKVKLYGFQHLEDKKMIGNLKKKIKGLKNEIETLQHLNSTNTNTSTSTSSTSTSINGGGDITMLSPSVFTTSINTTTTASSTTTSSNSNENYQYIDPNILKMLEKVDSQFSIANAINLSMSLKKWFHTCLNICSSIHFGKILQTILFNLCEMLHAEQAILFEVDYTKPHKLIAKYTKEGEIYKELPLEKGLLGHVIQTRKSINIKKAYEDARFYSPTDSILGFHTHDVLCIPIESEQKSILGVLQVANTKTRQGFSLIDQILAGLFGTQAGIVLVQNQLETNLLKNNDKLIKILDLPSQITRNCLSITSPKPNVNLVRLLFTAQKKFTEIVGIKKIKIFVLDTETKKIPYVWHVAREMDPNCNMIHVRCYSKLGSGLCSLVGSNETKPPKTLILEDPISNACYNDTVDLKSGTDGLYLVPILSPWDENQQPPLGFIQVARSLSVETLTHTIALSSLEEKKKMEDDLTIHLITIFARVLSGLLAHAKAIQLTNDCKDELKQAQIAFLNARLDDLEQEYLEEQEELQGVAAAIASSSVSQVFLEKNFLQTMEKKKNSTKSFIQKDEKDDQEDAKEEEMDRLAGTPSVNEKKVIEETSHHLDSLSLSVEHDMSFPVIEVSPNDPNDFGTISTMPSTLGMSIGLDDDMLGTLSPNVSRHRNMGVSGSSGVLPSNDSAYVIEFASPMSGDIGSVASSEDLKDVLQ